MVDYLLSESAKLDLKNINRFEYQRFGEQQAEEYSNGLIACFEEISKSPIQFQRIPELGGYHRCVFIFESLYYRVVNERVEIIAIIGRRDAMTRL